MNIAEVKNLTKKYPSFSLSDVSFELHEGEITGFVGRNGAGKTTTIKSILNLVHPDSGEIYFFGKSLTEHEAEIKKRIGYSTGSVSWYPRKRIVEIVDTVRMFYDTWDESAYRKYLSLFELDENKRVSELSEGMKVKFNLLLALSHKAEILILDEPTSGLDPFSRDELLSVFKKIKNNGVSIFFSTHIVSDIEKCADSLIYISHGKLVDRLPLDEFSKKYSKDGENIEETVLRLEREVQNEKHTD